MSQQNAQACTATVAPLRQIIGVTPPQQAVQVIPRHELLKLALILHDIARSQEVRYAKAA